MEVKIIATTGRARGEAVEIRAAKFFIGHHENCQIRPDITDVASIHALIEQRDSRYYLRDFGAEGGTGINDRVLHARETQVFDGDLIQVGPMVLTLSIRPKGDGPIGLLHAPEGWPFVEGMSDEADSAPAPARRPVAPKPELVAVSTDHFEPERVVMAPVTRRERAPVIADPSHSLARSLLKRPVALRSIVCETVDGVLVVTILPENLDEEETVSPVRHELRSLLEEGNEASNRMVIDLGKTRYLSSRAVGVLLAHYQAVERTGGTLRVCQVSPRIKPVLDSMRLSMLIDIYDTVDQAVSDSWG